MCTHEDTRDRCNIIMLRSPSSRIILNSRVPSVESSVKFIIKPTAVRLELLSQYVERIINITTIRIIINVEHNC